MSFSVVFLLTQSDASVSEIAKFHLHRQVPVAMQVLVIIPNVVFCFFAHASVSDFLKSCSVSLLHSLGSWSREGRVFALIN